MARYKTGMDRTIFGFAMTLPQVTAIVNLFWRSTVIIWKRRRKWCAASKEEGVCYADS